MTDPTAAEKAILAAERQALDRWSDGDPLGYSNAALPDVTYIDDIGAQRRVAGIDAFREYLSSLEGQIPVHSYEIVDPKVQMLGEVGVLTFRYHASLPDGETAPPWKATTVHRLVDGQWRLVHAHWSMDKSP